MWERLSPRDSQWSTEPTIWTWPVYRTAAFSLLPSVDLGKNERASGKGDDLLRIIEETDWLSDVNNQGRSTESR